MCIWLSSGLSVERPWFSFMYGLANELWDQFCSVRVEKKACYLEFVSKSRLCDSRKRLFFLVLCVAS